MNQIGPVLACRVALLFLPALAVALLVYVPALRSTYYLDDYYNLYLLEYIETLGWRQYIFGGVSGPFGRPVAMLSFALQHGSWPADPAAFKAVNLGLHIACGILILLIARRIGTALGWERRDAEFLGLGCAALWLLSPMHVTTVLYIVQRMAQLAALFMLLGMLLYLSGREALRAGDIRGGYVRLTAAVVVCTLFAMLSKENGALLPLLLLIVEYTLYRDIPPAHLMLWRRVFLVLPVLLLAAYLLWTFPGAVQRFQERPYGMWQKTITEAVVLFHYLFDLLLPRPSAFSLFHDDFPVSSGLLDPPRTLPALMATGALVAAAVVFRRRWPLPALGLLWFFAAHALESTHLNLEIYFEHRNYLASAGLFLIVAGVAVRAGRMFGRRSAAVAVLGLYAVLTAATTLQVAWAWRNPLLFAEFTARDHPDSPRAQNSLGGLYTSIGDVDRALQHYAMLGQRWPDSIYPQFRSAGIRACLKNERVDDQEWEELTLKAHSADPSGFDHAADFDRLNRKIAAKECPALDPSRLPVLMEALADNRKFLRERGALLHLAANLYLVRGYPEEALAVLQKAVAASPTIERQFLYVNLLLLMQRREEAERALESLRRSLWRRPVSWIGRLGAIDQLEQQFKQLRDGDRP